ncbi:MAG TPA: HipA domain-containing protein [Burkholderiaceae bacterium]|nr:HipA domain-containing protein [Burkholderiaceae bacterium]
MAGRPSRQRVLDAWMNGQRVGRWSVSAQGVHGFAYDTSWPGSPQARPLSLSLPLGGAKPFRGERVQAWFDNLLPSAAVPRQRLQSSFGAATADTFDLLAAAGRDCAGAVQLLPPDVEPGDPMQVEGEPLSERDLVRLLDACAGPPTWAPVDVKWPRMVLAGTQAKTALLRHGGRWCRPLGATPSTHILKLPLGAVPGGAPAISTSLENEWLCGQLLRAFGLTVATSRIEVIGPHKVLVIDRIDRRWLDGRWWARLPLEDFCQASGTPPQRCAPSAGGPDVGRMLDLLRGSEQAATDRERLLAAMVVMWLLAVPEPSGKRFAIRLLSGGRFELAPLWGAMSSWPLLGRSPKASSLQRLPWTLSPAGDALTHHQITRAHWLGAARRHALGAGFDAVVAGLAEWIGPAIDSAAASLPTGFASSVSEPVFEGLRRGARALSA